MYAYPFLTVLLVMMYSNVTELFSNVFSPASLPKKKYDNSPLVLIKAVFLESFHLE